MLFTEFSVGPSVPSRNPFFVNMAVGLVDEGSGSSTPRARIPVTVFAIAHK